MLLNENNPNHMVLGLDDVITELEYFELQGSDYTVQHSPISCVATLAIVDEIVDQLQVAFETNLHQPVLQIGGEQRVKLVLRKSYQC